MREYWPTGHLCSLAMDQGKRADWAQGVLRYRLNKRMTQESAAFQAREAAIDVELEALGVEPKGWGTVDEPAWAGQYGWLGASIGESLSLAPNTGFAFFASSGALGSYENHGVIAEVTSECIRLIATIDLRLPHEQRMSAEYVPVRWGAWRFMIAVDDMVRFCNEVRDDAEAAPYVAGFLNNRAYENPPSDPFPHVPARWQPYLIPPDVIATVTSARVEPLDARGWECRLWLTLDKGQLDGILPGMRLFANDNDFRDVEVLSVTNSAATVAYTFYERFSLSYRKPQPGSNYRTRRPTTP